MNINYFNSIKYSFMKRPFLSDIKICNISASPMPLLRTSGVTYDSQKKACLCAIGELFEREAILSNEIYNRRYLKNTIKAYSFIDKSFIDINLDYVISNNNRLVDSCGVASHSNSYDCIKNALEEFIERQSYIFNYLSKSKAQEIDCLDIDIFKPILNKFVDIKFYNISMIDNFYVILGKVAKDKKFYIGLGASSNIEEAMNKCIKELLQSDFNYRFSKISGRYNENYKEKKKHEILDYADIFYEIPCEKLIDAYSYLEESTVILRYDQCKNYDYSLDNITEKLFNIYKIKPLLVYLEPVRQRKNVKVAKILDLNWFKTLSVKNYKQAEWDFVEQVTGKKLDRKCNFLPFP